MNGNQPSGKMEQKLQKSGYDKQRIQTYIEVFDNILGSIREPLVLLDSDLKVVKANGSFYRTFKVKPDETEGILIYEIGNRQWNIPKLRELLEDILPKNSVFNDFEVEHNFETIGRKIMHLNARRIYRKSNQTQLILLAIEDVTDREYYTIIQLLAIFLKQVHKTIKLQCRLSQWTAINHLEKENKSLRSPGMINKGYKPLLKFLTIF